MFSPTSTAILYPYSCSCIVHVCLRGPVSRHVFELKALVSVSGSGELQPKYLVDGVFMAFTAVDLYLIFSCEVPRMMRTSIYSLSLYPEVPHHKVVCCLFCAATPLRLKHTILAAKAQNVPEALSGAVTCSPCE